MHHGSHNNNKEVPATIEDIGLSPDQIADYSRVFNLYDVDGSGIVSVKELAGIMSQLNSSISPEAIIRSVDRDQDGNISRFEFLLALSSVGK
jgi:Ca2+-binding EF-hand superfamily protein